MHLSLYSLVKYQALNHYIFLFTALLKIIISFHAEKFMWKILKNSYKNKDFIIVSGYKAKWFQWVDYNIFY